MFFERVFSGLQKRGIKYVVIGGVAVNLHGFQRATGDLDILISYDETNLKKLIRLIKDLGLKPRIPVAIDDLEDPGQRRKWAVEKGMKVFSVYNPKSVLECIDIMLEGYADFDEIYKRRQSLSEGNVKVSVISLNDLIKMKKKVGRKRDKIDVDALRSIRRLKRGKNS